MVSRRLSASDSGLVSHNSFRMQFLPYSTGQVLRSRSPRVWPMERIFS